MIHYFTLPGLGGSDEDHWQSHFEKVLPNCKRIEQLDWDNPICEDWTKKVDETLKDYDLSKVVIVTHSLGGIALAHWLKKYNRTIKAAFIVAPPYLEEVPEKYGLGSFVPVPKSKINFPTLFIASTNDQWSSFKHSKELAKQWGSKFVGIGEAGHINSDSGFGEWKDGQDLLNELLGE